MFFVKGLSFEMFSRRHRLALDTEHAQNSLLEQAKDNVETADTAQQQLKNHAPGTGIHIEGKQSAGQLRTPWHKRGDVAPPENTISRYKCNNWTPTRGLDAGMRDYRCLRDEENGAP